MNKIRVGSFYLVQGFPTFVQTLTLCLFTRGLMSVSSSQDVVESVLIEKFRTLIGDATCLGDVNGTISEESLLLFVLLFIGMLEIKSLDDGVGDDNVDVARIFNGGGLQSASQELPLFFRLF